MKVFGRNHFGALGMAKNTKIVKPTLLIKNEKMKGIACGSSHSFYYTEQNELYGFGSNFSSQLGIDQECVSTPILIKRFESKIKKIACGEEHTIILLSIIQIFLFFNFSSFFIFFV